ncbi:two-component regulator propeller domain-containing protein [Paraflavitalea sp. CAU 1676]|uniref:two-component regulator propeller domain-containing protein n=1 Tax=Paraflavitalea sp. CAU 1676 TaxID=3032598 RepID=UPI0023DBAF2B|nr:two-component regulator propeller domain-containing protein [Paraflavitalea sp. CAU 1676]MDF2192767.1 two-component regulator propeller domain-containing protein [Paraflavitalea sp. CAU 1676]
MTGFVHISALLSRIVLVFTLLITSLSTFPADTMRIARMGIEKGLSNNSVRCIFQDHNGFLWFGTYDGLNRYDGYEFRIFRNSLEDSNSLPHNFIYAINEDNDHNIWVGTGQGIGIYSNITGRFKPAFYKQAASGERLRISSNVNSIAVDREGAVYIGTNGGGLMAQSKGESEARQISIQRNGRATSWFNVVSVKVDRNDKVWLFIAAIGLCYFDKAQQKIIPVLEKLDKASCIEPDRDGNIWIGSTMGVYRYSVASDSLQLMYTEEDSQLLSNSIFSLAIAADGKLWIGTKSGGLTIADTRKHTVQHVRPGDEPWQLSAETVSAIFEDREGRKWMGSLNGGINIIAPTPSFFRTYAHEPFNPNSLVSNFAACFLQENPDKIWIGTDGGGISTWDRAANRFYHYRHEPGRPGTLSHNQVSSILKDRSGNIWISTFGGGINRFNAATRTFQQYPCINTQTGVENVNVWVMYEDSQHRLWATTFGDGSLYYYDPASDRFEVFSQEIKDLLSIFEDRQGTLWGGTAHDLIRIDRAGKKHIRYEIGKPVRAIYEDKPGNCWLGAEGGGLILFDRHSGQLRKRYTVNDGLANNAVLNILEDKQGNLWMSTFYGLSQFNVAKGVFTNYFQDDGLQSNQFLYAAALKLSSGEMLFGGIHGFNIFNPQLVSATRKAAPVLLTRIRINNLPLSQAGQYIRTTEDGRIRSIEMPYSDGALSVDFAALEFAAPYKISYAYFLEGWDKDWNYSGKLRTATYTKLNEGKYTLRIKATDASGAWTGNEFRMLVTVLPPWYRSWWAYGLYAALVISAIILYQRYRANQSRLHYEVALAKANASKEKAERERTEAVLQTQAAERAMEKVVTEKEQEINDRRLAFFTNISHEFRTPISLIINPIKELLLQPDAKKKDLTGLRLVYRNARRLLSLVDQLLLFRKAEAGADRLRIVKLDLVALCREVYLAFEQHALAANIQYQFQPAVDHLEIYADREKLEIAFFNLLSNAFKYTPPGGTITVTVKDGADAALASVQDTGYGIPADVGDKLFDRFYQVQKRGVPVKAGFGIGLFLVRHFVESLQGKIWYKSEEGKGSTFYIELLKGRTHFGDELIVDDQPAEPTIFKELVEEKNTAVEVESKGVAAVAPTDAAKVPVQRSKAQELDALLNEKKSILLVDDDGQVRGYLAQLFADKFVVYQADNALDGLKLAGQHVPDIIISDVNMDGMTGIEFCTAMKDDAGLSHIPIILLTGNEAQETKLEGLEGGADDYIMKPFDNELLMARVLNILKSRTSLQKYFFNEVTLGKTTYKVAPEYQRFLDNCIAVVEAHLDNPDFGIKMLATELNMGQSNLYKKVKSISGQSPSAFIRFIRLRKVAKTLIETNYNINEAAFDAGFNDMKYFREQFFKLFGMRPSEYVKAYRKGGGRAAATDDGEE